MSDPNPDDPPAGRADVYEDHFGNHVIRIYTVLPKNSPYYISIGRIASYWTHFEHILDEIIWDIAEIPEDIAVCITGQLMGANSRFKAIKALGKHIGISKELLKKANDLRGRQFDTGEKRNRVVHDPWFYVREEGTDASVTQLKASPPGLNPASDKKIEDLIANIRNLILEAADLQVQFRHELYALRDS